MAKTSVLDLEQPFTTTPSPRYFYLAPQYRTVLNHIIGTVVDRTGLAIVSGPVGSGKSTMFRYALDWLAAQFPTAVVAYVNNPSYSTDFQFLKAICGLYGIGPKLRRDDQMEALKAWLETKADAGETVALFVDEAHRLNGPQFELVRELYNFVHDTRGFYIQVVLAGESGPLEQRLKSKKAITSRALHHDYMNALSRDDVADLIRFRLRVAGVDENVFTPEAIDRVHAVSKGVPREVIKLCVHVYGKGVEQVTADDVDRVVGERSAGKPAKGR